MKTKMNERAILLLIAGIYITPYLLRDKVFPGGIYPLSILSWIGILLFLSNNYKGHGKLTLSRIKRENFIIGVEVAFALVFLLLLGERTGGGFQEYIKLFVAVLAPIIVL